MGDPGPTGCLDNSTLSLPASGPVDVGSLLGVGPDRPLELEIGFGKGAFILDRARQLPGVIFLGIEIKWKWVALVGTRAKKRALSNLHVCHGDAREVLKRIVPDAVFDRIFVNFPDPWWKARHQKRVLVSTSVVQEIGRLLKDGGELFVETDVDWRAQAYSATIAACPDFCLQVSSAGAELGHNPFGVHSLRERRCEELGLPVYRMLFTRSPRS